jgi:DNA-binding NarL/FixJ family response regulator
MTVRVLVTDDNAMVRRGLVELLSAAEGIDVVGQAANGREAVEQVTELDPDVVLMDLQMPRMGGVEATAEITATHPGVRVVVLTSFGEVERVHAALAAGASGYLLKDAEPEEVAAAVRAAAAGEVHLDSAVAGQLTRRLAGPRIGLAALTAREREILALVAQGYANREIADELVISERTARTHVSNMLSKLQLSSRTQAALLAIREGLIPPSG